jgi:hypothetical protein
MAGDAQGGGRERLPEQRRVLIGEQPYLRGQLSAGSAEASRALAARTVVVST